MKPSRKRKVKMDVALGQIRHVLTVIGGILATRGYLGAGEADLLVGAVMILVGMAWSAYEKR